MNVGKALEINMPRLSITKAPVVCVNPNLVIGMELETENCVQLTGAAYADIAARNFFNIETDGSLRGVAYEFISRPMQSQHAISAMTSFLTSTGFTDNNYSDRCSVHIHVNCIDLELEQVGNVALLYNVLEEILFEFVGGSRDTNIFCIPWNQCRQHYNLVANFIKDPSSVLAGWSKYTALNLLPLKSQGTIEFRQMHGTANVEKLTKWINIIGAIFMYATKVELKDLIETIKTLNTTSHYAAFFNEVLQGLLPYNDVYQQKLEEGIILAKFSLVGMGKEGRSSKAKEATPVRATIAEQPQFIVNEANQLNVNWEQLLRTNAAAEWGEDNPARRVLRGAVAARFLPQNGAMVPPPPEPPPYVPIFDEEEREF